MATTGINTDKVGSMQEEMDDYMKRVKNKIDISATSSQVERAIQGTSSEKTLKAYAKAIDAEIDKFVNQLSGYKTQLTQVKSTYIKDDNANTTFSNAQNNL